jgi:DNA invertase Pin-like site-specific DNA recombinase
MQVIGSSRVPTEDQARDGVSLSAQEAKVEAYCLVKDWTLSEVIRDLGESAKSLNRPRLQRLASLVQATRWRRSWCISWIASSFIDNPPLIATHENPEGERRQSAAEE